MSRQLQRWIDCHEIWCTRSHYAKVACYTLKTLYLLNLHANVVIKSMLAFSSTASQSGHVSLTSRERFSAFQFIASDFRPVTFLFDSL